MGPATTLLHAGYYDGGWGAQYRARVARLLDGAPSWEAQEEEARQILREMIDGREAGTDGSLPARYVAEAQAILAE